MTQTDIDTRSPAAVAATAEEGLGAPGTQARAETPLGRPQRLAAGAAREARYWKRVEWPSLTACWQWQGALDKDGYGVFSDEFAHRIAYRIWHGEIPHGHFVCHRCDNPRCVNPFHLVAWTPAQNLHDAIAKGRWTPRRNGTRNGQAKLDEQAVRKIRTSPKTAEKLAKRFGVSVHAIKKVRSGQRWAHVR